MWNENFTRTNAPWHILPQLNYYLSEDEIMEDLKIINKVSGKPINTKKPSLPALPATNNDNMYEARIDDGRLYFDKRWWGSVVY